MAKVDPYNNQDTYNKWKEKVKSEGIPELSKANTDLLLQYIRDMETGMNMAVSNKKGPRSFIRLNSLRIRIFFLLTRTFQ